MTFHSNATVRRLNLLIERDRLVAQIATMPYTLAWAMACADLAQLDTRLDMMREREAA